MKSSEWAASANALLQALHQPSHDPSPTRPWRTQQSRSRSLPPDRSALSVRSEHRHRARSRAAKDRETRQRSRSVSSAEPRTVATNSRRAPPKSGTQTPATDRRPSLLFPMPASPDTKDRTSRNQFPVAASALQLLPEQPSLDQSCSRARPNQSSGPRDKR